MASKTTNPYPLPHDASEKVRLDTQHLAFKYYTGGNVVPPIDSKLATQIIDVGTGPGKWVVEVAEEFPQARVTGIDLAYPIFEDELPPDNTAFIAADVNEGIGFPDNSVDLVHSRLLQGGVTEDQWPMYFAEALRVLKPGIGWIQVTEPKSDPLSATTGNLPQDSAFRVFGHLWAEWRKRSNLISTPESFEPLMKKAGFVDIQVHKYEMDIGNWRGDTTDSQLIAAREATLTGYSGAYGLLAWMLKKDLPENEREEFAQKVVNDLRNPEFRICVDTFTVVGRKPN